MATTGSLPTTADPVVLTLPVSWSGHTKEGAWVCSDQDGTGQCSAGQQVAPDGQYTNTFPFQGNLTLLDVNMTWQAAPGQAGLVLAAYGNVSAGRVMIAAVRGPSPLHLRLEPAQLADLLPDHAILLMAWPEGKTPTAPSLYVDATQQPFTVEGRMESQTA
jgi:hypothetical protein